MPQNYSVFELHTYRLDYPIILSTPRGVRSSRGLCTDSTIYKLRSVTTMVFYTVGLRGEIDTLQGFSEAQGWTASITEVILMAFFESHRSQEEIPRATLKSIEYNYSLLPPTVPRGIPKLRQSVYRVSEPSNPYSRPSETHSCSVFTYQNLPKASLGGSQTTKMIKIHQNLQKSLLLG